MTTRSIAEAKAQFAACVREAERGEPVTILRHGKPVAAVVSWQEWERLRQGLALSAGGLAGLAGRLGEAGEELYQSTMAVYRSRTGPRPLPDAEDA